MVLTSQSTTRRGRSRQTFARRDPFDEGPGAVDVPINIGLLRETVRLELETSRVMLETVKKLQVICDNVEATGGNEMTDVMRDLVDRAEGLSKNANVIGNEVLRFMRG